MSKFSKLEHKIEKRGYSEASARRITAAIGRRKIGAHAMAERAAAAREKHDHTEHHRGFPGSRHA